MRFCTVPLVVPGRVSRFPWRLSRRPRRLEYPDFRVVPGKSGYDTPGMCHVLALPFTSA